MAFSIFKSCLCFSKINFNSTIAKYIFPRSFIWEINLKKAVTVHNLTKSHKLEYTQDRKRLSLTSLKVVKVDENNVSKSWVITF